MTKQAIIALADSRNVANIEHDGFVSLPTIFRGLGMVYLPEISPMFNYQLIVSWPMYTSFETHIENLKDFERKLVRYFATFAIVS